MTSQIRQNFHSECEAALNKQINVELYASYSYQAMAWHFDRDDVALNGFHKLFSDNSKEEREHAEKMMKYQNRRGGQIVLSPIDKPAKNTWDSALAAMETALEMEKTVNQCLLDLQKLAASKEDASMCDWIESEFLQEQVEAIKKIAEHVTNLKRVGPGLGEYLFNKHTLE